VWRWASVLHAFEHNARAPARRRDSTRLFSKRVARRKKFPLGKGCAPPTWGKPQNLVWPHPPARSITIAFLIALIHSTTAYNGGVRVSGQVPSMPKRAQSFRRRRRLRAKHSAGNVVTRARQDIWRSDYHRGFNGMFFESRHNAFAEVSRDSRKILRPVTC